VENAAPTQGTDPDVKAFFDSLQVERHGDRAVLKATLPPGFIRKALAEYPPEMAPEAPPTSPAPAPKAGRKPQKADK
jgi:hypothetical protein